MQNPKNLCADCQHLRISPQRMRHGPVCAHPQFEINPVTGDPEHNCDREREGKTGPCGVAGKLFEQRDATTWVAWVSRPSPLLDAGYTV